MEQTVFIKAQLELLNMMSFVNSPQALSELKHIMSQYFASRAQDMMNEMWESGEMNDEKFESFRNLHERTPYTLMNHAKHSS